MARLNRITLLQCGLCFGNRVELSFWTHW